MTDKEKVENLLNELEVGFTSHEDSIIIQEGSNKVVGYTDYYAYFQFDKSGKFERLGLWEA